MYVTALSPVVEKEVSCKRFPKNFAGKQNQVSSLIATNCRITTVCPHQNLTGQQAMRPQA